MRKLESIKDELLFLSKRDKGLLNPQKVVEYAENPETFLHSRFEWDDEKAGYEYRLWQARQIISLEFEIIKKNNIETGPVRLFISLKDDRYNEGGYRLITDIINDENLKQQLLSEAFADLNHFKEKYKTLKELAEVFSVIEKVQSLVFEDAK